MKKINPTAVINQEAVLGSEVSVGHCSIIDRDVHIDDGTTIGSYVRIKSGSRIGKNCTIQNWVVIGVSPQSLAFDTSIKTYVEIGDNTSIGDFTSVERATTESYTTRIGACSQIHRYCHVAHDNQIGHHVTLFDFAQFGGHTHIGDYTVMKPRAIAHQFSHVGKFCECDVMVRKDVPPFTLFGSHHKMVYAINVEPLRKFYSHQDIESIKEAYRLIYNSGFNFTAALEKIQNEFTITPPINEILTFFAKSKRGIARGSVS